MVPSSSGGSSQCFRSSALVQSSSTDLPVIFLTVKSQTDTMVELELVPFDYTKEMWEYREFCAPFPST
jgi:hypothetical protein